MSETESIIEWIESTDPETEASETAAETAAIIAEITG